jgi:putative DNA primase/helicase
MSAAAIAKSLRGRQSGKSFMCCCPVHDDRTASLQISDRDDGDVNVHCHAGCDWRDVKRELARLGLAPAFNRAGNRRRTPMLKPRHVLQRGPDPEPNVEALEYWRQSAPLDGTLGERYLRQHRGLPGPFPPSIRFLFAGNALVAGISRADRKVIAVQRTFLSSDGSKAKVHFPRLTTAALGTSAVRLGAVDDVIGIAEGVETALAAMELTGVPCWACLGAQRLSKSALPLSVREVHIFADNDEPSVLHATAAAKHYALSGRRVYLRRPRDGFNDWNDVLLGQRRAA